MTRIKNEVEESDKALLFSSFFLMALLFGVEGGVQWAGDREQK